jgi:ectoine hydroxylase-related dioxygenase (phytanoyl-CoA dioxygenase family)
MHQAVGRIKDRFDDLGYSVVRGLFAEDEVAAWGSEVERLLALPGLVDDRNWRTPFRKRADGSSSVEKLDPVVDISPVFAALAQDHRLIEAVRSVLLDPNPVLLKDKVILKPPGQDGYPLHQDYNWWHRYPPDALCTAVVAIDQADARSGAIEFFQRRHQRPLLEDGAYRSLSAREAADLDDASSEIVELAPGDIVIFHSLTPHCSSRNLSDAPRRAFYPTYARNDGEDVYEEHARRHRRRLAEALTPERRAEMFFR